MKLTQIKANEAKSTMQKHPTEIGRGTVTSTDSGYQLTIPAVTGADYHDAQISSYTRRGDFDCVPPLTLRLRAKFEGDIRGTAGFGFWNHPYAPNERHFSLPRALWFFYGSPPNNMALAKDVPGYGFKSATFDATRPLFFALLPTAPVAFLLMRVPALYNALWGIGQRAIGVSEAPLDDTLMGDFHDYVIHWEKERVEFFIDGARVHSSPHSPRGPLGFIAWIDNQYAIVTPQGNFGFGLLDTPGDQSLLIDSLTVE